MNEIDPMRIITELEKGFGEGDLTLIVTCTKCDANFSLNNQSVAMSIMNNTSFIEYLRWVQSCACVVCKEKE
jgi:hypothetical protein